MWNILDRGLRHLVRTKQETDRLLVQRIVDDTDIVENNARHRSNGSIQTGDRAPFHPDGAEIGWHFQIEPSLWHRFKKEHPDVYLDLIGKDQFPRERAAAKLAAMFPQWVVCRPKVVPSPSSKRILV